MSKKEELTDAELAQLAYERSNASLKDYNPHQLDDEDKEGEPRDFGAEAPKEPTTMTADGTPGPVDEPREVREANRKTSK